MSHSTLPLCWSGSKPVSASIQSGQKMLSTARPLQKTASGRIKVSHCRKFSTEPLRGPTGCFKAVSSNPSNKGRLFSSANFMLFPQSARPQPVKQPGSPWGRPLLPG